MIASHVEFRSLERRQLSVDPPEAIAQRLSETLAVLGYDEAARDYEELVDPLIELKGGFEAHFPDSGEDSAGVTMRLDVPVLGNDGLLTRTLAAISLPKHGSGSIPDQIDERVLEDTPFSEAGGICLSLGNISVRLLVLPSSAQYDISVSKLERGPTQGVGGATLARGLRILDIPTYLFDRAHTRLVIHPYDAPDRFTRFPQYVSHRGDEVTTVMAEDVDTHSLAISVIPGDTNPASVLRATGYPTATSGSTK
jgi:hypothetical protein